VSRFARSSTLAARREERAQLPQQPDSATLSFHMNHTGAHHGPLHTHLLAASQHGPAAHLTSHPNLASAHVILRNCDYGTASPAAGHHRTPQSAAHHLQNTPTKPMPAHRACKAARGRSPLTP
jgi:hypothetical protein